MRRGLAVAITPSVTPLLTADAIRRLADAGIGRVALSLDGPDAATHDAMRGVAGAFARTMEAIGHVRAAGLGLQINTSVARRTAGTLGETGRLVAGIAPALWSVFLVVPTGRAGLEQQLSPGACEEVLDFLYDWGEDTALAVKTTAAPAYRRVVLERDAARRRAGERVHRPRSLPVNDGKGFVFVSHTGEVYPSGFLPLPAGEVRDERLADIYRHGRLFRALRATWRLEGKCGVCPFNAICGGSRARAYASTGNCFAEDPACAYQPSGSAWVEEPRC